MGMFIKSNSLPVYDLNALLFKRDNTVKSSITISIAREPEKPLSGQGSTHTESSNAAALCTLKYLASKYNSK